VAVGAQRAFAEVNLMRKIKRLRHVGRMRPDELTKGLTE
jgi:hypothetical protein